MAAEAKQTAATRDKIDRTLDGDGDIPPWERAAQEANGAITVVDTPIDFSNSGVVEVTDNEETALVPAEDGTPSTGRVYQEFYDFDIDDLSIPRLRIASGQSQEVLDRKAMAGQFLMPDQAATDTVEIVILAASPFRSYRVEKEGNRVELCKSDDGKRGIGTPGGICARCPLSQWGERNSVTGKSAAPLCSEGWSYQLYSLTHGAMAVWDLSRTGIQAARKINTSIKMRKYRNFVMTVNTQAVKGPSGTYFVPVMEPRPITKEEREEVEREAFV